MVLPGGIAGLRGIRWDIYMEVTGSGVLDVVGVRGVAGGEFCGAEGYAEDDRMARG